MFATIQVFGARRRCSALNRSKTDLDGAKGWIRNQGGGSIPSGHAHQLHVQKVIERSVISASAHHLSIRAGHFNA